jgi:choline-sulfatase
VRRPDIVLVMTDEQRFDWVGYASDGHFETPTLDRLAADGVCFEQAYSASVVCVPSRTSLLTGLHHHRCPQVDGELALRSGFWTVARQLRHVGYETALIGRMHFKPIHADHGFDTMRMCENINPGSGYGADDLDDYHEWLASEGRPDWRMVMPGPNGDLRAFNAGDPRTFPDDADHHPTAWIERETTAFLRQRDRSRPLFLVVSFPHPHAPYDPPEPYASMYSPDDAILPTDGFDANDCLTGQFAALLDGPAHRTEPEKLRLVLTSIRGLVRQIDDSLGRIVDALDLDSTLLFFTSDHGDYGGHRGLFSKYPWIPFEDLIRVPLVVTGGAVGAPGTRSPVLVQSASFAATCLDYAGVAVPDGTFDFPSLRPLLDGDDAGYDTDRPVFANFSLGTMMVRYRSLKLVSLWTLETLLFDLADDPGEIVSHSDDPDYHRDRVALLLALRGERFKPKPTLPFGDSVAEVVSVGTA